jgi:hypothetical protein
VGAVDLDPLVDSRKVRRGIETDAVSSGSGDAGKCRGGGSLAIGACDKHAAELPLRMSEGGGEGPHLIEVKLSTRRACINGRKLVAQPVKLLDRVGVGHVSIVEDPRAVPLKPNEGVDGAPGKFSAAPADGGTSIFGSMTPRDM